MRRFSVLLILLLLLAGCSVGEIRRPVPTPLGPSAPPPASASAPVQAVDPHEVRRAAVPVPGDFDQNHVEFTDVDHGYVLFTRCGPASSAGRSPASICTALVLATADGGRSWRQLRHPQPVAENHRCTRPAMI